MNLVRGLPRGAFTLVFVLALTACGVDSPSNEAAGRGEDPALGDQSSDDASRYPFTAELIFEVQEPPASDLNVRTQHHWTPWFGGYALQAGQPGYGTYRDRQLLAVTDGTGARIDLLPPVTFHSPSYFAAGSYQVGQPGEERYLSVSRGQRGDAIELRDFTGNLVRSQKADANAFVTLDKAESVLGTVAITKQGQLSIKVFDPQTLDQMSNVRRPLPGSLPFAPELLDAQFGNGGDVVWVAYRLSDGFAAVTMLAGFDLKDSKLIADIPLEDCFARSRGQVCDPQTSPVILNTSFDGKQVWAVSQGQRALAVNMSDGTLVADLSGIPDVLGVGLSEDPSNVWVMQGADGLADLKLTQLDMGTFSLIGEAINIGDLLTYDRAARPEGYMDEIDFRGTRVLGAVLLAADRSRVWFLNPFMGGNEYDIEVRSTSRTIGRQYLPAFGFENRQTILIDDESQVIRFVESASGHSICIEAVQNGLLLPGPSVPCTSERQLQLPSVAQPMRMFISPEYERLFVYENVSGGTTQDPMGVLLHAIDLNTLEILNAAKVDMQPNIQVFAPEGDELWLASESDSRIMIFDTRSGKIAEVIDVDAPLRPLSHAPGLTPSVMFAHDGSQVVAGISADVNGESKSRWVIIDPVSKRIRGVITSSMESNSSGFNFGWNDVPHFGTNPTALYVFGTDGQVQAVGPGDEIPVPDLLDGASTSADKTECMFVEVLAVAPNPERIAIKDNCGEVAVVDAGTKRVIASQFWPGLQQLIPIIGSRQALAFERVINEADQLTHRVYLVTG